MLKDFDPYDYAKAVRVFQKSDELTIQFQLFVESNPEVLAVEVVSANGARCVQMELDEKGNIFAQDGRDRLLILNSLKRDKWLSVEIHINSKQNQYQILIDKKVIGNKLRFAIDDQPERIIFRTGRYRLTDDVQKFVSGDKYVPGWDKSKPDEVAPETVYYIKDFVVLSD